MFSFLTNPGEHSLEISPRGRCSVTQTDWNPPAVMNNHRSRARQLARAMRWRCVCLLLGLRRWVHERQRRARSPLQPHQLQPWSEPRGLSTDVPVKRLCTAQCRTAGSPNLPNLLTQKMLRHPQVGLGPVQRCGVPSSGQQRNCGRENTECVDVWHG